MQNENDPTDAGENSTNPRWLEIIDGTDKTRDNAPMFAAEFIEPENDELISFAPASLDDVTRLMLAPETTKAEAMTALDRFRETIDKYWGNLCRSPQWLWSAVYDARAAEHDNTTNAGQEPGKD